MHEVTDPMARKSRSQRFQPLQKLVERKEETAAKQLGLARRKLAEAEQRLLELRRFREEYCRQLQQSGQQGLDGRRLQSFQQFLSQLDVAIGQQQEQIESCRLDCERETRHWESCHREQRILQKTVARFRGEEQRQARRREQKLEDDQTTGRYARKRKDF